MSDPYDTLRWYVMQSKCHELKVWKRSGGIQGSKKLRIVKKGPFWPLLVCFQHSMLQKHILWCFKYSKKLQNISCYTIEENKTIRSDMYRKLWMWQGQQWRIRTEWSDFTSNSYNTSADFEIRYFHCSDLHNSFFIL